MRIVKDGELERTVELVARQVGPGGAILILLDADDDCPATLGPQLRARALAHRSDRLVFVVLAKREFESWFIAAAESLAGKRTLNTVLPWVPEPENIHGAKEWLGVNMAPERGYSETLDQPAFAAEMDIEMAARAPSFAKLLKDLKGLTPD
jgi:hypothetical protein